MALKKVILRYLKYRVIDLLMETLHSDMLLCITQNLRSCDIFNLLQCNKELFKSLKCHISANILQSKLKQLESNDLGWIKQCNLCVYIQFLVSIFETEACQSNIAFEAKYRPYTFIKTLRVNKRLKYLDLEV